MELDLLAARLLRPRLFLWLMMSGATSIIIIVTEEIVLTNVVVTGQ